MNKRKYPINHNILHLKAMTKAGGRWLILLVYPLRKLTCMGCWEIKSAKGGQLWWDCFVFFHELCRRAVADDRRSLKVLTHSNCFWNSPAVDQVTKRSDWSSEVAEGAVWGTVLRTGKERDDLMTHSLQEHQLSWWGLRGWVGSSGHFCTEAYGSHTGYGCPWEGGLLSRRQGWWDCQGNSWNQLGISGCLNPTVPKWGLATHHWPHFSLRNPEPLMIVLPQLTIYIDTAYLHETSISQIICL